MSKGSARRPRQVPPDTYDTNWVRTFGNALLADNAIQPGSVSQIRWTLRPMVVHANDDVMDAIGHASDRVASITAPQMEDSPMTEEERTFGPEGNAWYMSEEIYRDIVAYDLTRGHSDSEPPHDR